jgi:hypothetical protein
MAYYHGEPAPLAAHGHHGLMVIDLRPGPSGKYFHAGETVTGVVGIETDEHLPARDFRVRLRAEERVIWKDSATTGDHIYDPHNAGTDPHFDEFQKSNNSHVHTIFKTELPLLPHLGDGILPAGQYVIPVSFRLPPDCLPSMYITTTSPGGVSTGSVVYELAAAGKSFGTHSNLHAKWPFEVFAHPTREGAPVDVTAQHTVHKFLGIGNGGEIGLSIHLDHDVYQAGDTVTISARVDESGASVSKLRAELVSHVTIGPGCHNSHVVAKEDFPAGETTLRLTLPHGLKPSCYGKHFKVRYGIKVVGHKNLHHDAEVEAEIIVYTTPADAPPPPHMDKPANWHPAPMPAVVFPPLSCH